MTTTTAAQSTTQTLEELATALDAALARLKDVDEPHRSAATEAMDHLHELHRRGLVTIVRTLRADPQGKALLFDLVDDPEVRMLFSMYGIIRVDPRTAAQHVLDQLAPELKAQNVRADLVAITAGVAQIRLLGIGCASGAEAVRDDVIAALLAGVPGLAGVEVLPPESVPTFIPVDTITVRRQQGG